MVGHSGDSVLPRAAKGQRPMPCPEQSVDQTQLNGKSVSGAASSIHLATEPEVVTGRVRTPGSSSPETLLPDAAHHFCHQQDFCKITFWMKALLVF